MIKSNERSEPAKQVRQIKFKQEVSINMVNIELTNTQTDEILHCLRTSYLDYDERLGASYNDAITSYNNQLDEIITTIKNQLNEQDMHEN